MNRKRSKSATASHRGAATASEGLPQEPTTSLSTICVASKGDLKDDRGVDRQQIREILAMTPAERVAQLVASVAVWTEMLTRTGLDLESMRFDPRPICAILNEEGVRYVLIGGFAAAVHGSPLPTSDVDVVLVPR